MKKILLILIFFANCCYAQSIKEKKFAQTVNAIVKGFSKQDSAAIAKYIDKETGLYLIYRNGVFDEYMKLSVIGFIDETFPQVILSSSSKGLKNYILKFATLPKYSCDKEGWSKLGLYTDTNRVSHLLSQTCKDRNKYVPDNIPVKTIQKYYSLENKSRRVVLADKNNRELVFYLSYLKGKWYLTIVDAVSSDCSA